MHRERFVGHRLRRTSQPIQRRSRRRTVPRLVRRDVRLCDPGPVGQLLLTETSTPELTNRVHVVMMSAI